MKKHISILSIAFLLAGCATTTPTADQQLAIAASITRTAVGVGGGVYLMSHPGDRSYFAASEALLSTLLRDGASAEALLQAIQSLPVKELQGDQGVLIIGGALAVLDIASSTWFDITSEPAVKAIATAVRDGLKLALASAPAAAPVAGPVRATWTKRVRL